MCGSNDSMDKIEVKEENSEMSVNASTEEVTAANEASSEKESSEETSIEETSIEETFIEETSAEETPVEETTIEETTIEETTIEETTIEETNSDEESTEEASTEEPPTEEPPAEETPTEEGPAEEASSEETSSNDISAQKDTTAEEQEDEEDSVSLTEPVKTRDLSERLQAIVDYVKPNQRVADIGCDHAYVSIELARSKGCAVYAMDINEGPLAIAEENIHEAGLSEQVVIRQSDGLDNLGKGDVDAIVIAGMGGHLIVDILKRGQDKLRPGMQLVLSPHSDLRLVRYELRKMNCFIESECCLNDGGKWYFVLNCKVGLRLPVPVSDEDAKKDMLYGKYLPEHPTKEFREFLKWEERGLGNLLESLSKQRTPAARARQGTMRKQLQENLRIQEMISWTED